MGIKRIVDTSFWEDEKVMDMFTPEDKLFMLYLLTNPHTTQLGIYQIHKKLMAFEMGYSLEAVGVLLDRFENKYNIIRYSAETSEIAVRNYLRHSIIKGGKPVEDLLVKEVKKVKNKNLLHYVCDGLANHTDLNETVKKIIQYINDNDNENDVSYHDSYHDSSTNRAKSTRFIPPTYEEVSAYCKERNNGIDPQRFVDWYQARGWKDIKDWKACVRTWEQRNKKPVADEDDDDFWKAVERMQETGRDYYREDKR